MEKSLAFTREFCLTLRIKKFIQKEIKKEITLYINFENPKLVTMDLKDLTSLLDSLIPSLATRKYQ